MGVRTYQITVTVPAGTPQSAPASVPWSTEDNTILDIEIEIPPGHNGLTGIRVMKGDVQLLPFGTGAWITANNYSRVFPIGQYMPTSDITIQAYNLGAYAHNFFLRMSMTLHDPGLTSTSPTETDALNLSGNSLTSDPLSPDALLGADTVTALIAGDIQPSDLAPVDVTTLMSAPNLAPGS